MGESPTGRSQGGTQSDVRADVGQGRGLKRRFVEKRPEILAGSRGGLGALQRILASRRKYGDLALRSYRRREGVPTQPFFFHQKNERSEKASRRAHPTRSMVDPTVAKFPRSSGPMTMV